MDKIIQQLRQIYFDTKDAGGYGGVDRLLQSAREKGLTVNREQVENFLKDEMTYTLHKPIRKKFPRSKTVVFGIDSQWQADLADMQQLAHANKNFKYILTVIDVFSRYAYAVPIKSKSAKDMLEAFETLLQKAHPRKPHKLQTDKGKEFLNSSVQKFLKDNEIEFFTSNSDFKAALVERFNRTLKQKLWRYFTAKRTHTYLDVLDDIVNSYNNSVHRSIGMRPSDVTKEHEYSIWQKLYATKQKDTKSKSPHVGDLVRISKLKRVFDKGYLPNWSTETFIVDNKIEKPRTSFHIRDTLGEPIQGKFYKEELQHISDTQQVYYIEKILKTQKRNGEKYHLVKWEGWPDKHNSWVADKDIQALKEKL